jgi:hypothetical protein
VLKDVFTITGRGTVVTGRVEQGAVKVGDEEKTFVVTEADVVARTKFLDEFALEQQGFRLVAIGLLLGLVFAFIMSRLIDRFLYGVSHNDIAIFAAATLLLGVTAVLASYVPARRAAKIDPMVVLRYE